MKRCEKDKLTWFCKANLQASIKKLKNIGKE